MENLRGKSRIMRSLYIENEALLNLYIRPFIEEENRLNDELAEEFLNQIIEADDEGYEDDLGNAQHDGGTVALFLRSMESSLRLSGA